MDELMALSGSVSKLIPFRLALYVVMDSFVWLCLSAAYGSSPWSDISECLGRSSSSTGRQVVVIGSSTPRVVAITRSLIPSGKRASPFVSATTDLFFSSLGRGSLCSDSLRRALWLYGSSTYLDIAISTTTPMTSTGNRDQH